MTPSAAVTRVKANLESWVPSGKWLEWGVTQSPGLMPQMPTQWGRIPSQIVNRLGTCESNYHFRNFRREPSRPTHRYTRCV